MYKAYTLIFIVLFIIACWLRLDGVFTNSFAFTYDVGRDMLALRSFAAGHVTLIGFTTGLPGVFYGPWWYVFLLPSFLLSHGNPQAVEGFLAAIGVVTVVFVYIWGRKLNDTFLALVLFALSAVSPRLVSLASQIWNPNIAPFWMSLLLLCIVMIIRSKNKNQFWLWVSLGLVIGFLFEAEIVFGILFILGFLVSVVLLLRNKISILNSFGFITGGLFVLSPRILFELRHNFLMTKSAIAFFTEPGGAKGFDMTALASRFQFMLNEWSYTVANNNVFVGLVILICVLIVSVIFWKKLTLEYKFFLSFGYITTLVAYMILVLFHHPLYGHYLVGYPILWIMLVGLTLGIIFRYISRPIAIVLCIILFIYNLSPVNIVHRFTQPLFTGDAAVYRNQLAVIDSVYSLADHQPFAYIVYTPPIQDYTYQYLFSWYGRNKYGYTPLGNPRLLFAIIEPDFDHPTLETQWIQDHANNGKISKTIHFSSGIIVQERVTK